MIPHARAIRALMVAMIKATFRAAAVPLPGGRDRAPAASDATHGRAVRLAPIARRADREETLAAATDFLTKRCVHGVGAAAVRSNWTYSPNRGTTDRTPRRVGARGSHEGPEDQSGPSPSVCSAYAIPHPHDSEEAVDADGPLDARTRPQVLAKPRRRGFAQAPTAILDGLITEPDRNDPGREKSRFLRFYVADDTFVSPAMKASASR